MSRPTKKRNRKSDTMRQAAPILRLVVWAAILVMLGVMLYRDASERESTPPPIANIPQPLPEAERPKLPIDTKLLATIEDNMPFQKAEHDAWFHLIYLVRSTPDETLRRATLGPITWIQLFNQTDVYRGQPITLVGHVQRATRLDAPKNDLGIEHYYQLWLQPHDSRDRRIVVYSLELPDDFPTGTTLDEPIVVTGLFFKRWLYGGQNDIELAPVVVARSFDWIPRPAPADDSMSQTAIIFSLVIGLLLAITLVLLFHLRTRRLPRNDLPEEIVIPDRLVDVRPLDDEPDTEEES